MSAGLDGCVGLDGHEFKCALLQLDYRKAVSPKTLIQNIGNFLHSCTDGIMVNDLAEWRKIKPKCLQRCILTTEEKGGEITEKQVERGLS